MVRLAIRDDDCNFFTKKCDLESVYSAMPGVIVSYAVIPCVKDVSTIGRCPETKGNVTPMYIGDNIDLCNYLNKKLVSGNCDVIMHGIDHSYMCSPKVRLAEMEWRDKDTRVVDEIILWKNRLSRLFNYSITCFVAPSNKIGKNALKAVVCSGMNFSGIITWKFNRSYSVHNIVNYIKRWFVRAFARIPYPGVLDYGDHKEINACTLQSYKYLVKVFSYCEKHNLPMVINVHYWHLRDNPDKLSELQRFYNYAVEHGAIPTKLTDLLK